MKDSLSNIVPPSEWGLFDENGRRLLIAGPCSAESPEQVMASARMVRDAGVPVFRAGLWKQRTRPGAFEGVGFVGLQWLRQAREQMGLKIATEVSTPEQVDACLAAGVDLLWIGARTTANPMLVQSLCDALKGSDVPVLVKNPVNQDIDLWIGALERLNESGVTKLGAVLRGFSTFDKIAYRNEPVWQAAVALKTRYPRLPVLCDPSHMAGDRDLVPSLAQKAMQLGLDGLMVEAHSSPERALSDARQQLGAADLLALLASLPLAAASPDAFGADLATLRARIDDIDSQIIALLSERMDICRQIGDLKRAGNLPIIQASRWDSLLTGILSQARSAGLDESLVRKIFTAIHESSVAHQS